MKKSLHVLFDGRMVTKRMHGVARHLINLIHGLNKVAPQHKYTVILNNKDAFEHFGDKVDVIWAKSRFLSPMEFFEIPRIIKNVRPDIFHNPSFSALIPGSHIPYVMTIHDLTQMLGPYKFFVRRACKKASAVLTVSEFSKKIISKHLNLPMKNIEVINNGIEDKYFKPIDSEKMMDIKRRYNLPESYILYVGGAKAHKNVKGAVLGYIKSAVDVPLVITLHWEEIAHYFNFSKPANIICIGSVPGNELLYIYHGARLFLFPSLIEGFGFPVIEAFACGVPVITSNYSALPETNQGCAIEINPLDIDAIATAVKIGLYDEHLRQRNIALGLKHARNFTCEHMAEGVLRIYEKIISGGEKR
jgi:glycosyltransferase involved in cell wall biosynthesis